MHLDIFDFDDTLCISNSRVGITSKETGEHHWMMSHDWYHHHRDDDKFDYDMSQFIRLSSDHEPIWNILRIAKESYNNNGPEGLIILTARHDPTGPLEFLDMYNMPDVKVYAIGDEADTPPGKAGYIERFIDELDLTSIRFFDDSPRSIKDAQDLKERRPDIRIKIIQLPRQELEETRKFL